MKTKITKTLWITLLFGAFALAVANAAPWAIHGNIPFQFTADGKVWPAGEYMLVPDNSIGSVRVEPEKGVGPVVPVITRLSPGMESTSTEAHAVFDKVGDTYFLSEVWIPGEDGFLLHVTKQAHEHKVVNLPH